MENLNKLTLIESLEGLKGGKFSSEELTRACLNQIEKYDEQVKSFLLVRREDALNEARAADKLIAGEGDKAFIKQPLLGIPYAAKDNFCTQGIETTASSMVLKNFIPPYESTVTKRLKEAGAVVLGKTNMDAFAHGSSVETSDYFITRNPWNTEKVPGGSSGGSAAALAAHMCTFAIGSETAGSIRGPAAWCGVTGLKPTYGRVSRYGVIAMASSTDSPGPITKTVEDAAKIMEIIAGKDPFDATTSPKPIDTYQNEIKNKPFKGMKIGKPKSYFEIDLQPGVVDAVNTAISKLEELGAEIIEIDLLEPKYSIAVYTILQRSEVSSNLARFDGIRFGQNRDFFGHEARKRMMLGAYALSAGYYDQYYAKAQKVRTLIVEDFKAAYEKVDLIVGPAMPSVALDIGESDKSPMFGELMDLLHEPSSIAGLCGITVPCGLSEEMPVGLQFIGPFLSESILMAAAHNYQTSTEFHKKEPELINSQ